MDITLNEYIHENFRTVRPDGRCKILYENCENRDISDLTGTIYLNEKLHQTFYLKEENEIILSPIKSKRNKVLSGFFKNENGSITLIWNKEPNEHFLCVSYEYKKIFQKKHNNWESEGF